MNEITNQTCHQGISAICEQARLTRKQLAELLDISPSNITRIEKNKEAAGEDFMNRLRALQVLGYAKFKELSPSHKKKAAAAASGQALTITGILAGLTALGTARFATAGAIAVPLLGLPTVGAALLGYGVIKALKHLCTRNKLSCREDEGHIIIESTDSSEETENG